MDGVLVQDSRARKAAVHRPDPVTDGTRTRIDWLSIAVEMQNPCGR